MQRYLFYSGLSLLIIGLIYYLKLSSIPGVSVSSWWRTPWHNWEVGGEGWSLHQIGLAWDLVPDGPVTQAQVIATGLPFLLLYSEGDHLHTQFSIV